MNAITVGLGPVPLPEHVVRAARRGVAAAAAASAAAASAEVSVTFDEVDFLLETAATKFAAPVTATANATTAATFTNIVDESVLFTDGELSAYAEVNVDELMSEAFAMSPNSIAAAAAEANATMVPATPPTTTTTAATAAAANNITALGSGVGKEKIPRTATAAGTIKRKRNRKTEAQVKKERKEQVQRLYEQNKAAREALSVVVPGLQEMMPFIKLLAAKWGI